MDNKPAAAARAAPFSPLPPTPPGHSSVLPFLTEMLLTREASLSAKVART